VLTPRSNKAKNDKHDIKFQLNKKKRINSNH